MNPIEYRMEGQVIRESDDKILANEIVRYTPDLQIHVPKEALEAKEKSQVK